MEIEFSDFEAFLEYYYKQQSQGTLPSSRIKASLDGQGIVVSLMISFLDSDMNLCKVHLFDANLRQEPKLVKEMILHSRIKKEEN